MKSLISLQQFPYYSRLPQLLPYFLLQPGIYCSLCLLTCPASLGKPLGVCHSQPQALLMLVGGHACYWRFDNELQYSVNAKTALTLRELREFVYSRAKYEWWRPRQNGSGYLHSMFPCVLVSWSFYVNMTKKVINQDLEKYLFLSFLKDVFIFTYMSALTACVSVH